MYFFLLHQTYIEQKGNWQLIFFLLNQIFKQTLHESVYECGIVTPFKALYTITLKHVTYFIFTLKYKIKLKSSLLDIF